MLTIDCRRDSVRALRLERGRDGLRILEQATLPLPQLQGWLARRRRQEVRVAAAFDKWVHKPLTLPAVRAVLPELVARETRHLVGDEVEASFEELGVVEEGGESRLRVLATAVGREELDALARIFHGVRVEPALLTTTPLAHREFLRARGLLDAGAVACLDLEVERSSLMVYKDNEIRVIRNLPYGSAVGGEDLGLLLTDIKQTFFFHGAKFRGEPVTRLVVAGAPAGWDRLAALASGLDLEVVPLPTDGLVAAGAGNDLAGYETCLGLALLEPERFPHALVPGFLRVARRDRALVRWFAAAAAVLAVGFALPAALMSREAKLASVREVAARRDLRRMEAWLSAKKQAMIARSIMAEQPAWEHLARELVAIVPAQVLLASLTVQQQGDAWEGSATGQVLDPGQVHGLRLTRVLQERLGRSPFFIDPIVEPQLEGDVVAFTIRFRVATREVVG